MSCDRTCPGDCCAVVGLSSSYRELLDGTPTPHRDRETLIDMLEPLTYEQARERMREFTSRTDDPDTRRHYYRCSRWDEETRLCTRYDERPDMCAAYPYDGKCDHDCGFTPAQNIIDAWKNRESPISQIEPETT